MREDKIMTIGPNRSVYYRTICEYDIQESTSRSTHLRYTIMYKQGQGHIVIFMRKSKITICKSLVQKLDMRLIIAI